MPTKPKAAVVIGRFQPFHNSHEQLIDFALSQAEMVVVCLGSAYQPRTSKNPWTVGERMEMIHRVFNYDPEVRERIVIVPIRDHRYSNHLWIAEIQNRVYAAIDEWVERDPENRAPVFGKTKREEVVLCGHQKDDSSFYLSIFGWRCVDPGNFNQINATELREQFLTTGGNMSDDLPPSVREIMGYLRTQDQFKVLRDELEFLTEYRLNTQRGAPFPVQFITVDAVVTQSGHVLMVKRGGHPGLGQWALPGGFVNHREAIEDAVIRELQEETCARISEETLRGSIAARRVYDAPDRDLRGRIVTHGFLFKLPEKANLPKVKGSDDAVEARWVSFGDFMRMEEQVYGDHFHIVNDMLTRGF